MEELTPREKLEKIRERFANVDLCISKKTGHQVTISVDTLYELMFTKNVI